MRKTSDIIWQDAQHQTLFHTLELIKQPASGRQVITRLDEYTENHFVLEEQYMLKLDYPGREEHVKAHDSFRGEVRQLLLGDDPDELFREVIATYLKEWLVRHVFGIDKDLEAFILSSDVK